MYKENHADLVRSVFEETIRLRHVLHQNPELSGEEKETLAFIAEHLDALNISYTTYSNGGICACIGQGERAVGVRADIDALPIEEKTALPYTSKKCRCDARLRT
ncbi:MAG: amidohydrolase [Clostridia bacterium]|nr:amidohydrolase [Clostridia bacterium]